MNKGFDKETLDLTLESLKDFTESKLPEKKLLELDAREEFPVDIVREMCGPGLGIQLLFIPEEFEGMGGGAFDVYRVCEELARVDLGVATGVLATFLGSDPIIFGGTYEQKKLWMTRIGQEGLLMAYGATEPEAGSDLAALRTVAEPVSDNGTVSGYRITGNKQWISNGGYADLYCVLAKAPGGPSWFIVERTLRSEPRQAGGQARHTGQQHRYGLTRKCVCRCGPPGRREEGQGLIQAQLVFGYTRLMVAAFGLGAGWAALDRAIPYSQGRIQGGAPLSEKQGYTHKLIVPNAVKLEVGRAFIEETAERIDSEEGNLNTEGAIAKYLATEAGNFAADASIQALGGYGYTREYMVEKIKRDVRITRIYEGTSEIMEMTICRDRWQTHLKTHGEFYHDQARQLEELEKQNSRVGAGGLACCLHGLAELLEVARLQRLTRHQHVLFRLGELMAYAEGAASLARRAARSAKGELNEKAYARFSAENLAAFSRIAAREAAMKVVSEGARWIGGLLSESDAANLDKKLYLPQIHRAQAGIIQDMDYVADVLYGRVGG